MAIKRRAIPGTKIYFAGAAGVGKTTVAHEIRKLTGLPVHEVEAENCWRYPPSLARQRCFAETFLSGMKRGPGIYTNHLLSVYGYTKVMVDDNTFLEEIELMIKLRDDPVVVLYADKEALAERIQKRLKLEKKRATNVVEKMLEIHLEAQKSIIEYAKTYGYPIIDTTSIPPLVVARKILDIINL